MHGLIGERLLKHFLGGSRHQPERIPEDESKSQPTNGEQSDAKPKRAEDDGLLINPEPIVPKENSFTMKSVAACRVRQSLSSSPFISSCAVQFVMRRNF